MVAHVEKETIVIVNTKYLPNNGITVDVGGMISTNIITYKAKQKFARFVLQNFRRFLNDKLQNKERAMRIEIHKVIFSLDSLGKPKLNIVRKLIPTPSLWIKFD